MRRLTPEQAKRAIVGIRLGVAQKVRAAIAVYPPPPKYPLRWASRKQRFWFKKAVEEGRIQVPYVRQFAPTSQRLGPSWVVAEDGRVVGTRVTYAPYVQSAERQQPFHADTGWKTDKQAVEEVASSGDIPRIAEDVLTKVFGR